MKPPVFHRLFNYDRAMLPNPLLRELEEGVADIETARTRSGLTIGYPGWGLIYYAALGCLERGEDNQLIETGSNWGCSTIVLAQALKDSGAAGHVTTFEIDPATAAKAREHYERAGVADRVTLIEGDAKANVPPAMESIGPIRLAFLDGCHLQDDVVAEFAGIEPYIQPGGLVLFDNTYLIAEPHEDQRVNGALKTITDRWGGNLINFPNVSWYTPGLAIWQREPFPN